MPRFQAIGLDADDTLWHNEKIYLDAQNRFQALLAHYHTPEWIAERLYQTEMRNLAHFGYGIKSFTLSMIETAIELTEARISAQDIQNIIENAKTMLAADVELIEHVGETLTELAQTYTLMLITKGDLRDQELKIARSGVTAHLTHIEIVSDKSPESYEKLLKQHSIAPGRFVMVGNSLRSDILPVLEIGGTAVYIAHPLTWAHESAVQSPTGRTGFYELENFRQLPQLLANLEQLPA